MSKAITLTDSDKLAIALMVSTQLKPEDTRYTVLHKLEETWAAYFAFNLELAGVVQKKPTN